MSPCTSHTPTSWTQLQEMKRNFSQCFGLRGSPSRSPWVPTFSHRGPHKQIQLSDLRLPELLVMPPHCQCHKACHRLVCCGGVFQQPVNRSRCGPHRVHRWSLWEWNTFSWWGVEACCGALHRRGTTNNFTHATEPEPVESCLCPMLSDSFVLLCDCYFVARL